MPGFVVFWAAVIAFASAISLAARRRAHRRPLPHDLRNDGPLDVHQHFRDPIAGAARGAWGGDHRGTGS